MNELIDGSLFEESDQMESAMEAEKDTVTPGIITSTSAVTATSAAGLTIDLHLSATKEWCRKFLEADPSQRSILLCGFLEDFADGVEGISISFSEPKYREL